MALGTTGQTITPSEHVTIVVGPNNAGKSALLSGIQAELARTPTSQQDYPTAPVDSIRVRMPPFDEFLSRLGARGTLYPAGRQRNGSVLTQPTYFFLNGQQIPETVVHGLYRSAPHFGQLAGVIALHMGPEGRGGPLYSTNVPDMMIQEQALQPLQQLWTSRALQRKISGYMMRAFGRDLVVNRHAGATVHLHMGSIDVPEPTLGDDESYRAYLNEAALLPLLSAQGAGMQAFMGTMLTLAAHTYDIVLLDEPETFLHPPQARLLGEVVMEMSRDGDFQVIAATHSDDFVQGVISAARGSSEVSIARITRPSDAENRVAQVAADSIRSLYQDPLMRYSRIIDGIFYKGTVICEAESDCTYYSASLAAVEEADGLPASDILFSHCGGKDRMVRAFAALKAAAVPTAVIADIDLLSDKAKFRSIFETMGGDFASISSSFNVLEASILSKRIAPKRDAVQEAFDSHLSGSGPSELTKSQVENLRAVLKFDSGWNLVKKSGADGISNGDPRAAFESISAACRAIGLFILGVGELEGFHRSVPGNKQAWLRQVLEREMFKQSAVAHDMMREVRKFISRSQ